MPFFRLKQWANRRRLRDPAYSFLFEPQEDGVLVALDTETTSLVVEEAELLSIGAVKIRGDTILTSQKLELLVKPSRPIGEESIKIHRLRHCDLDQGVEPLAALNLFLEFVGSRPLVGYFLSFDVAILNKYLRPWLGITLPNRCFEVSSIYHDKKIGLIPTKPIDLRFDVIREDLAIPSLGQHIAIHDAIMSAMIYVKLQHLNKVDQ